MKKIFAPALALLLIAGTAVSPAFAHKGGDDRGQSSASFSVSREQALAAARNEGLVDLWESKARRGEWKFEGADADGFKLEVSIDGHTGQVVKVERYRGRSSSSDDRRGSN